MQTLKTPPVFARDGKVSVVLQREIRRYPIPVWRSGWKVMAYLGPNVVANVWTGKPQTFENGPIYTLGPYFAMRKKWAAEALVGQLGSFYKEEWKIFLVIVKIELRVTSSLLDLGWPAYMGDAIQIKQVLSDKMVV